MGGRSLETAAKAHDVLIRAWRDAAVGAAGGTLHVLGEGELRAALEAEAAGVRGTGIGCFFDDVMHDVLGIQSRSWQSLYHFTVGGCIEDLRLQTMPAYVHLDQGASESGG